MCTKLELNLLTINQLENLRDNVNETLKRRLKQSEQNHKIEDQR